MRFELFAKDKWGLVWFEYVIVTAFIVTVVGAAFTTGPTNPIMDALTTAMNTITGAVTASIGG